MSSKKAANAKPRKGFKKYIWELLTGIGIPLVLALIVKTSVVEAYVIPSGSMENTLYAGDHILGNKFVYGMKLPIPFTDIRLPAIEDPKPGDVVVFKYPEDPRISYIKRCVAVAGQTVEIRDKQVYVDGKLVELPPEGKHVDNRMIPLQPTPHWGIEIRDNMPPIKVPPGKLFMMGDNRDNSADSRFWGFLDRNLVLARAIIIFWSWEYQHPPPTSSGTLSSVDLWVYTIKYFPELVQHIRWNRIFQIAG
jgi:signal peptidase I